MDSQTIGIDNLIFRIKNTMLTIIQDGFSDSDGRWYPENYVSMNKEEALKLKDFIEMNYGGNKTP